MDNQFSFGAGSEYKYDWGYFNNNGSYQASTKGHSDNISIYTNFGWNIFDKFNLSLFGRNDKHKYTGNMKYFFRKWLVNITTIKNTKRPISMPISFFIILFINLC